MIKNILIGTVFVLVMVASAGATEIKVAPASQTVAAGDAFHVAVTVEDVEDMKADQAVLNFNPGVMHVTGVAEGDFLKTGGSTIGLGMWDNTAGTATFGYSLGSGTWTPVGGGGTLATIEFEIHPDASAGIYDLSLTDVVLIDAKNDKISTGLSNDVVTILSPTTATATATQTRTSTHDGGGKGVVVFDATEESTTDMNITDTISPTPVATTPDTVTNISVNATTDTPIVQTPASTPSSVPGLSGIDAIAAICLLAILFAIKKRKWK